jgi:hypothetical protein
MGVYLKVNTFICAIGIWWVEYQFHISPGVPIGTPDRQFANTTHQKFRWNLKNAPF